MKSSARAIEEKRQAPSRPLTVRGWSQSERFDHAWALLAAAYRLQITFIDNVVASLGDASKRSVDLHVVDVHPAIEVVPRKKVKTDMCCTWQGDGRVNLRPLIRLGPVDVSIEQIILR